MKTEDRRLTMKNDCEIPGHKPFRRGKVRDFYQVPDPLNQGKFMENVVLCVTTDRISAFDRIMGETPGRGAILCAISNFWKSKFNEYMPNDLYKTEADEILSYFGIKKVPEELRNRISLVYLAESFPFEFVVRGYLAGSLHKEYKKKKCENGYYFGQWLPAKMKEFQELDWPLLTPTTKSNNSRDESVNFSRVVEKIGRPMAERVHLASVALYLMGHKYLQKKGLMLADTKFEFGLRNINGRESLCLIDEVLTPDSSRFWFAESYRSGQLPVSLDKQYYRDWLKGIGWNDSKPAPRIPKAVQQHLLEKYEFVWNTISGC
ncbi:MAG: phosphoribosylaminoimidazolesuccinocarboxamide synthase [Candidatus Pacebacteria bacterium]|nr:phosphoribosylaminoimidazolesuccinocarboxamide synthase [Candidatus Paceibacterota bacterium]